MANSNGIYDFEILNKYEKSKIGNIYINPLDQNKLYMGVNIRISDYSVSSFFIEDNFIYCKQLYENNIYKINIDGLRTELIFSLNKKECTIYSFYVNDNGIYIYIKYNNSNGTKLIKWYNFHKKLVDIFEIPFGIRLYNDSFVVANKTIFFVVNHCWMNGFNESSLYAIDEHKEFIYIKNNVKTIFPKSIDGLIFITVKCTNEISVLYKINSDSYKAEKILMYICNILDSINISDHENLPYYNLRYSAYNISDGWIYFSDPDNKGKLSKVKINCSSKSTIANENRVKSIIVFGDWVYYKGINGETVPSKRCPGLYEFQKYDETKGEHVGCRIKTDGSRKEVLIYEYSTGVSTKVKYVDLDSIICE